MDSVRDAIQDLKDDSAEHLKHDANFLIKSPTIDLQQPEQRLSPTPTNSTDSALGVSGVHWYAHTT